MYNSAVIFTKVIICIISLPLLGDNLYNSAPIIIRDNLYNFAPIVIQVIENSIFLKHQPQPLWRHVTETLTICILVGTISMITSCISIVLEINVSIRAIP